MTVRRHAFVTILKTGSEHFYAISRENSNVTA